MIDEIDLRNIKLIPYTRYNKTIDGLFWKNITFNEETGIGSFILKFNKKTKTINHVHFANETFFIIEGDIYDSYSNKIYYKNNIINMYPGSSHYSYSENGCLLLVFSEGHIKRDSD
jgi:mannose-6-phosphate isomerase-like protein (cupin superfamily)